MIWKAPRFFMRGRHLLRQVDPLVRLVLPRHRAWILLLPELHRAGIAATVGKGVRNQVVIDACVETGSVYFVATGGAAALLAQRVESGEVVAYDDLGTEALRRIVVRDFPVLRQASM